jgi:hypothetical protein
VEKPERLRLTALALHPAADWTYRHCHFSNDFGTIATSAAGCAMNATCPNCGRTLQDSDPIPSPAFETTAVVRLRALFSGRLAQTPCPAECGGMLDHEPALMVMARAPHIVWLSGGDSLDEQRLAVAAEQLGGESSVLGGRPGVRVFTRQETLKLDLYEHLRVTAGAMSPLNRASAENKVAEFVVREWRTLTPAVLAASDIVTLVERMGGAGDPGQLAEARNYFEAHALALGRLQLQSWIAMCQAHARFDATMPPLREDLAQFVVGDAVFESASSGLIEQMPRLVDAAGKNPLLEYALLATAAYLHHVSGSENPLAAEWTTCWARLELTVQEAHPEAAAGFDRLRLQPEVLSATLSRRALQEQAVALLVPQYSAGEDGTAMMMRLQALGDRAGYTGLVADVHRGIQLKGGDLASADGVMVEVRRSIEKGWTTPDAAGAGMSLDAALQLYTATLVDARDVPALTSVFEQTRQLAEDDPSRAMVESWFGATLGRLNRAHRLLDHIGADERSWEDALEDDVKARLWTERANALRAAERRVENLQWRERIVPLVAGSPGGADHRVALHNLAIAHREAGAPDRALDILLPLLDDRRAADRHRVLEALATTYGVLGEQERAAAALDEAIELCVGPAAYLKERFVAARASLGVGQRPADVEQRLLAAPKEAWSDAMSLLQECTAWANLHLRGYEIGAEGTARFGEAANLLARRLTQEESDVPPRVREAAYLVLAEVAEMFEMDNAHALWGAAADEADRTGQTPNPVAVLALAQTAYREQRVNDARLILAALPDAMARDLHGLQRIDVALGALTNLRRRFDELTLFLIEQDLVHDARVLAEFRRDPVRQSGTKRTEEEVHAILGGAVIKQVLTGSDAAVLEFLEVEDSLAVMLTWRRAGESRPSFTLLDWPEELEPVSLRDRLLHRLQGWLLDRPGDPFAVTGWNDFQSWIRTSLDGVLAPDGHLIVIEHEALSGLPFHVAVAPERSCSYASSWSSLARNRDTERAPLTSLGVAMVPAFDDDARVAAAMHAAETRSGELAARNGLAWQHAIGAACDRAAVTQLMQTSDVLFIACHGFLDEARHEVAWVLAHKGGLPGRSGSVASGAAGRVTHFSWRDVEMLPRAPRLVLSAACSSGRALLTGLGERLGLFPSLKQRGTETLIAPAWDVDANIILPVATRALELSLDGTRSRAAAVRIACEEASHELPLWIAWSLTLEGAWR